VSRAVIIGLGGLGCPAALALAEVMPGLALVLVDDDVVEVSNLPRQILFAEEDAGRPKALVAAERLATLTEVEPRVERFTAASAPRLLAGADVLLDGTDNFETRFLANDAALAAGVPLVHGAALGYRGQVMTILPGQGPCLRCLFEGPPPPGSVPACAEAGVLAPLCGVVGAAMAGAALDVLHRRASPGILISWDRARERRIAVPRDPACRH